MLNSPPGDMEFGRHTAYKGCGQIYQPELKSVKGISQLIKLGSGKETKSTLLEERENIPGFIVKPCEGFYFQTHAISRFQILCPVF